MWGARQALLPEAVSSSIEQREPEARPRNQEPADLVYMKNYGPTNVKFRVLYDGKGANIVFWMKKTETSSGGDRDRQRCDVRAHQHKVQGRPQEGLQRHRLAAVSAVRQTNQAQV